MCFMLCCLSSVVRLSFVMLLMKLLLWNRYVMLCDVLVVLSRLMMLLVSGFVLLCDRCVLKYVMIVCLIRCIVLLVIW